MTQNLHCLDRAPYVHHSLMNHSRSTSHAVVQCVEHLSQHNKASNKPHQSSYIPDTNVHNPVTLEYCSHEFTQCIFVQLCIVQNIYRSLTRLQTSAYHSYIPNTHMHNPVTLVTSIHNVNYDFCVYVCPGEQNGHKVDQVRIGCRTHDVHCSRQSSLHGAAARPSDHPPPHGRSHCVSYCCTPIPYQYHVCSSAS